VRRGSRSRGRRRNRSRHLGDRSHGTLVAPTFLHGETLLSRVASGAFALTGFPAKRRFTGASLRAALESDGVRITHSETLGGLIPVGYVEGTFAK
jgi:hypothetical protein